MDPFFEGLSDPNNGFQINQETILAPSDQYLNLTNDSLDFNFFDLPFTPSDLGSGDSAPSSSYSPEAGSPSDYVDDPVLNYIRQILLEEGMEKKPHMVSDSLALHAAEKSLYEVLGEKYPPPPPKQRPLYQTVGSPDDNFSVSFSDYSNSSNSVDPQSFGDLKDYNKPSLQQSPLPARYISQPKLEVDSNSDYNKPSLQQSPLPARDISQPKLEVDSNSVFGSSYSFSNSVNVGLVETPVSSAHLVPNFFSDSKSALQFSRMVQEASRLLSNNNNLVIDLESYKSALDKRVVALEVEDGEREDLPNGSRGMKRDDIDLEDERSTKQSAVYVEEEDELSEMFDKVLLYSAEKGVNCEDSAKEILQKGMSKSLDQNVQPQGSKGGKRRAKKPSTKNEVVDSGVDLRTLLILSAQAVSSGDHRTANELLKQIRQHSSPTGDGSQRSAHFFANALEARMNGTGAQLYTAYEAKRTSAADILKAYHVYLQACPFKKIPIFFAVQMILKAAEKATTLHVIDFGISYGFQWPVLIQYLASRAGGPPKLRITGIELPQPGFRPAAGVEETGRRLAKYCNRFKVPFEYNAIAQKWETIQIEDLKIDSNEVLAVNCLYRFHNLLDETVVTNSPRDAILKLIRKMNPNIFIHAVINAAYNVPFFVTRFREAIFHFSALFDMFDDTIPREEQERLMFEKEFCGRQALNVIACEDTERVERAETCRQWHGRTTRAGFQPLPLDQEVMKKYRAKLKAWYHKDFVIDEDGPWMQLGWKGRIMFATSCWAPS